MKNKLIYIWRYWFWQLSRVFCYLYLRRKFNLKVDGGDCKIPKPPFIMISNHGTFFDPWLIGHFSRWPLSIMNNEDAFKAPAFSKWYMKQIGTFPKKKGASDFKAMKETLKRIKLGYPVLIFPEGQTTWDGKSQPIYPGIDKIVKMSKASLVIMNLKGNFMSKPWWANSFRRGEVSVSWNVFAPEEIKAMKTDEIVEAINKGIEANDVKGLKNKGSLFKGKELASGIKRFLWKCPSCFSSDSFMEEGNNLSCSKCNKKWEFDSVFNITGEDSPGDLLDWSQWHKDEVKKELLQISDSEIVTINEPVVYHKIAEDGKMIPLAKGKLKLTKNKMTFTAQENDKSFVLSVSEISDYVYQRKDIFECRSGDKSYRFQIIDGSPMKWVYYFRYLNNWAKYEEKGLIG